MQACFARFEHVSLKLVLSLIIVVFYDSYLCTSSIPTYHFFSCLFFSINLKRYASVDLYMSSHHDIKKISILLMKECIYEKFVSKVSQSIYSTSLNTALVLVVFQLSFFSKCECFKGCQGHQVLQGHQGVL